MESERITIVGGGAWGTALAIHLAGIGHSPRLWVYEAELAARIRERRDNPVYLPGIPIPETISAVTDLREALEGTSLVLGVVPSHHARAVYERMAPHLGPSVPVLVGTKGLEEQTLALPLQIARETLGERRPLAVLSGPSFAREVASGLPAAVVVAADDGKLAVKIRDALSSSSLRLYTNGDPTGVQLAGALKNVMAIAAGLVDGLGMGSNSLGALITRGLAEISRLGTALGGRPSTFSGLAGLGDLVLTCTGSLSRNRRVGRSIAQGQRLQDILASTRAVAEGVRTAASARQLAGRAGVEMPIVEEVHRILYEDGSPREAVTRLMSRPLTSEDPT